MDSLVVALHKGGKTVPSTFEAITAARGIGSELMTAVLAADGTEMAESIKSRGGGKITVVNNQAFERFCEESYAKTLQALISKHKPKVVLIPGSIYGKGLASRLAAMIDAPMASEVTALSVEGEAIVATRPHFGGSVISKIVTKDSTRPFIMTLRPKVFAESTEGAGEIVTETIDPSCFTSKSEVIEVCVESSGSQNLAEADVIVSAGRGIKGAENAGLVQELADAVGGALGASRAVVDAGWMPYMHQVGQTGKTVNPKLYIAVGISGAIQHLVGMQSSHTIVAINKDKDAPIFSVANYGIVGDLFEILPALTKKFKQELQ